MVSQQFTCCICLSKDQSVKKLSTKARVPTEGPERQEVINKGQSAYRRTRASKSYQQRPDNQNGVDNKNDQEDGNHTRIGRSYTMGVPMNISSYREVGDLAEKREGQTRPLSGQETMQEADHRTTCDETMTTPNTR